MAETFTLIDKDSSLGQEFRRLYDLTRELRPGDADRWNGKLYSRDGDLFGGLDPKSGSIRLSQEHVLHHLSGPGREPSPARAQALLTVLHESYHARVEIDARHEPNAVRGAQSMALDEGLTERMAINDFPVFARHAGYDGLRVDSHSYEGGVAAVDHLVDYAAGPDRQDELLSKMLDQPVVMRWDVIADEIVQNKLGDVVPQDPQHQQAARAELVEAMAHDGWFSIHRRSAAAGRLVGADAEASVESAMTRIHTHYQENPGTPYPSASPNQDAVKLNGEQARVASDLAQSLPPAATARVSPSAGQQVTDPALRAATAGTAPAAGAIHAVPNLADGARGRTGVPSGPAVTTDTGRNDR